MKKILHISKFFHPYFGGIEDVALTIYNELQPHYLQEIICFSHNNSENDDLPHLTRVKTICSLASQPISVDYKKKLQNKIDEFQPDFIHLHLPNPLLSIILLSTNLRNAKIIVHWHADILGQKLIYPFYKSHEQKILQAAYKIIATSQIYIDYSLPLKNFVNKTYVLPNTINEEKLALNDIDKQEIAKIKLKYDNKKIIFFVGRHVEYKGIEHLIESEKYIESSCVIVIAGTGALTEKLKARCVGKSRIVFLGKLSNDALKHYLYASYLFAFPSVNRSEAFGVALAEALYCGLPAVSFDIQGSGALWVNQHMQTGLIVQNKNAKEFGNAIEKLLCNSKLRNELAENAQVWVKRNFLKSQILPLLNNIYA